MKIIFAILATSMLVGIEGGSRGSAKYRGRQLPFAGQPDVTEEPWPRVDLQKVERRQDSAQDDTGVSAIEDLDDTIVVGDVDVPLPESPNAPRQFYPGWTQFAGEVPKPITPPAYPPQLSSSERPSYPPSPLPPQESSQRPTYPPTGSPTLPPGCLTPRGQFPSSNNCANYLNCWDDIVIEQRCPNDLLFNDVTGLCDFEYNVDCGSRPGATPKPPLPPGSRRCPDLNGRYRSATNCSEFYVCLAGSPIKFSCPRGLVYNDAVSVCDYTYNVDCQGAATPKPEPLRPMPTHPQPTYQPEQTESPYQTQRPQPTFPPGAYPQNPWLSREAEADPWHQRPVSAQFEIDMKQEALNDLATDTVENEPTETPTIQSPWGLMHSIPAELAQGPCDNGSVHRLDDACANVVVCRNKRPQLVQCPQGLTYDRPSDSCRHFASAKC